MNVTSPPRAQVIAMANERLKQLEAAQARVRGGKRGGWDEARRG